MHDVNDLDDSPIGRAFRLVEVLARNPEGQTLSEIALEAGLVVTTAHRQLNTLVNCGIAKKTAGKSFVPGDRLWSIVSNMTKGADIAQKADPILQELADRFGETAFLARLNGHDVEIMSVCTPTGLGRQYAQPGRGMPLYATSSGKVLLALQSPEFIEDYLRLPRRGFTPDTITDSDALRSHLATVSERQFAVCNNEFDPGILSYAAAVIDPRTSNAYSIAVFGMAERFSQIAASTTETQIVYAAQRLASSLNGIA